MKPTNKEKIAVIIPAYKVKAQIRSVVESIPSFVDYIIVVNDACPEDSYKEISHMKDVIIIHNKKNLGVGGAMISGYKKAIELGADIGVKLDGDGQMDPIRIQELISPIILDGFDYAKGNRFQDFSALKSMPKIRLFGNGVLSFWQKAVSGYWKIMDPSNGYTAITVVTLKKLPLEKLSKRFYFETDMLVNLNIIGARVKDVAIPAKYGAEKSSLHVLRILVEFPFQLTRSLIKRIFLKYYIYDFNMASVYLLFGVPFLLWGIVFGTYRWWFSISQGIVNSTGTVMLSILPIMLSVNFIIAAINIDINSSD